MTQLAPAREPDLSVTALYTSRVWLESGFPHADLFATRKARGVYRGVNGALAIARLFRRGAPVLSSSLAQRHAMIDRLVKDCGARQVIELAAGLSPRGAERSADAALRYVEVDLPAMMAQKRQLLARSDAGRAVLERKNLELVDGDVRGLDLDALVTPGVATVVVAEGLFMYLELAEQRALWVRVAAALARAGGGSLIFDLTPRSEEPRPGLLGRALGWLMRRFTRDAGMKPALDTRDEIVAAVRAAGFAAVEVLEPGPLRAEWKLPFPEARTKVVLYQALTSAPSPAAASPPG